MVELWAEWSAGEWVDWLVDESVEMMVDMSGSEMVARMVLLSVVY